MPRLALAGVLALALAACSLGDATDAANVLFDLRAGSGPSTLKERTPPPTRMVVSWTAPSGDNSGDLYRPADSAPEAAMVLAPGLAPEGRRDPRLVALANTLARARFAVLVPDVPGFQAQRVGAADGALLADALRYLRTRPEGQGPLGIGAVSYAVGPAILAALEPDLADVLDVVVAIGGYYDTRSVVTFFTTGHFRADSAEPWRRQAPNAYGKWVFVLANAERLDSAFDRVALTAMARRKLENLDADIGDLAAGLGHEGRAVVDLLTNADPDRVPALIAALPDNVRRDLEDLSLARRDLGALRADMVLIHGRDDAIIPFSESVALARAAGGRAHLALLDSLAHADLGPGGLLDAMRLWRAVYVLMSQRRAGAERDDRHRSIEAS
jgi:pimeloyl-ACP methyl ester carboxylesterase